MDSVLIEQMISIYNLVDKYPDKFKVDIGKILEDAIRSKIEVEIRSKFMVRDVSELLSIDLELVSREIKAREIELELKKEAERMESKRLLEQVKQDTEIKITRQDTKKQSKVKKARANKLAGLK